MSDAKGTSPAPLGAIQPSTASAKNGNQPPAADHASPLVRRGGRRKRADADGDLRSPGVRFFTGDGRSNADLPSLREEHESEGAAILAAFKSNGCFYRVEAWMAKASVEETSVSIQKAPVK
jgi:hypothetical protein